MFELLLTSKLDCELLRAGPTVFVRLRTTPFCRFPTRLERETVYTKRVRAPTSWPMGAPRNESYDFNNVICLWQDPIVVVFFVTHVAAEWVNMELANCMLLFLENLFQRVFFVLRKIYHSLKETHKWAETLSKKKLGTLSFTRWTWNVNSIKLI